MNLFFSRPEYLWLIPLLILVFTLWRLSVKKAYIAVTTLRWVETILLHPSWLRRLPLVLLVGAFVLLILASLDPILPFSEQQVESRGLDIGIVLDLSDSMQEIMSGQEIEPEADPGVLQDMSMEQAGKTRLDTTKDALRYFIGRRNEDRIALVVFSNSAYVVSPLTLDYDYLLHYLDMLDGDILSGEGMTAIGDGIALANYLLYRQHGEERRNQVILVFTDGEHNIGQDPLEVLPQSNALGIRVHTVGVDFDQRIRENEAVLQLIEAVETNGGNYFEAGSEEQLFAVSSEIDSMEKHLLVSTEYTQHMPVYYWFAIPALILILLAMGIRMVPYFADYT